jgi:hypothetical protein
VARSRRRKPTSIVPPPAEDEETDTSPAQLGLDNFLNTRTKVRRSGSRPSPLSIAIREAERCAASGDWTKATGRIFVGLYALCHRSTYGVDPVDLDEGTLKIASSMAKRCMLKHFDGDPADFVDFIQWTWEREKERENWALRKGVDRSRLSVRFQFSAGLVTDYRVSLTRGRRNGRR